MSIYDKMAAKYDQMIRWNTRLERETPFLQRLFAEKRIQSVLDLGCGTGKHSQLMNKWGCRVVGVDSSESLVEIAKSEIKEGAEGIDFVVSSFISYPEVVDEQFDAVLSLGNTLPHVANLTELRKTLENIYNSLKPGGVVVFQSRNYDRLMESRERFLLPLTHRAADTEQIFFRFNDFEGDKVRFNVVHFTRVGDGWIHEVYSSELQPLKRDEYTEILKDIGFTALDFYGDFSGTPFDPETSTDIVGMARKPAES